ncbi:MAG: Lpg1974 family pore-forming outer membrane protein, partial [Simkaniaceae bacterium]|nr:Lpg1974 family pore-forming outer membrane protein [Simkaniaceae bacterium]
SDPGSQSRLLSPYSGDPTNQRIQGAATLHQLIPNSSLALGIGYGTYFSNDTMHFNAKIGFETQYYNNQRIILDGAGSELIDSHYSDLSLYGFNFSVGLDF